MASHHTHHSHGHAHRHPANYDLAFAVGVVLNLAFVAIEAFYGFAVQSLALLADAGHNLSDVLSLLLAWAASWLARRKPSQRRTYGFGRTSILASMTNAIVLLIAVGAIALEAARRLMQPVPTEAVTVMWVAVAGIAVNAGTALMFAAGRKADLNIRGAFLHMTADAAVSLGVMIAALVISRTGWLWLDPALSLAIVAVIGISTFDLLRDSFNLALDAVPKDVNRVLVERFLAGLPGVTSVHDLHIWSLSTSSVALTAHLVVPERPDSDDWLHEISAELHERFGIDHVTIQVERGNGERLCKLAPDEVI